jgi:polysaccharide biosynthesis protein PslH
MMDVLFIASRFPAPTGRGDQVRGYHQIRLLAREHNVTLLAPSTSLLESERWADEMCAKVVTFRSSRSRSYARLPMALVTRSPIQNRLHYDPRLGHEATALLQQAQFDIAHVQLIRAAAAVNAIRRSTAVILDMVDALSLNMARRAARTRGILAMMARHEASRVAEYERYIIPRCDRTVISSEIDRSSLGPDASVGVVPNGIDLRIRSGAVESRDKVRIVFTGTMNYFPNVDAARWFAEDIFPLIQRRVPDVTLDIIGPHPTPAIRALEANRAIRVLGFVPEIAAHIREAGVAVAPMRSGSGTQFKVLEAMAVGTPVVATSLAVAGLTALPDLRLHVADNPTDFSNEVSWVLQNPVESAKIASTTMNAVRSAYSWEASVESLVQEYGIAIAAAHVRGVGRYNGA